jgi:hypothetical protein
MLADRGYVPRDRTVTLLRSRLTGAQGQPYAALTPDQRLTLLAGLAALPG